MLTILAMVLMTISTPQTAWLSVSVATLESTMVCISVLSVIMVLREYKEDSAKNVEGKMNP
jgi:hypothetical protein